MSKQTSPNNADLEAIGKAVIQLIDTGHIGKKQFFIMSFLKGVLTGLGGVIGATVAIALLLWFLSLFENVPLIGEFTSSLESTIDSSRP